MTKTMNNKNTYNSPIIDDILNDISSNELENTRNRMIIAARIDDAIKAKGWKMKDFAVAMSKTPSEITKWLSGTHNFTMDTLFDISKLLGIEIFKVDTYIIDPKSFVWQI